MIMVQYSLHVIVEKVAERMGALILLLCCWIKKSMNYLFKTEIPNVKKNTIDEIYLRKKARIIYSKPRLSHVQEEYN